MKQKYYSNENHKNLINDDEYASIHTQV